ncbi:MAG: hypothetical protein IT459_23970, partial [Planctomycetes bacterium]|nr:hypothetical protein [Planctomycetota bacterium]
MLNSGSTISPSSYGGSQSFVSSGLGSAILNRVIGSSQTTPDWLFDSVATSREQYQQRYATPISIPTPEPDHISAAPPRTWLQGVGDWVSDLWNVDSASGGSYTASGQYIPPRDYGSPLSQAIGSVFHRGVQPVGRGVRNVVTAPVTIPIGIGQFTEGAIQSGDPLQYANRIVEGVVQRYKQATTTELMDFGVENVTMFAAPGAVVRTLSYANALHAGTALEGAAEISARSYSLPILDNGPFYPNFQRLPQDIAIRQPAGKELPGIWLNDDAPFRQSGRAGQACGDGAEGCLGKPNA